MLPISLRPNGRRAVIVGGGDVAARKAESVARAGFPIFVVAERIGDRLRALLDETGSPHAQRAYETSDLSGAALVVAATNDGELNARIVADARAVHALACDAANPGLGDFTMPATQRVGTLTIGVDSGGNAPAFSRRVARDLAAALDPRYAGALDRLAHMRTYVKETFAPPERAAILRALAERPLDELAGEPRSLVCATRESALAMTQSRSIAARLAQQCIVTTMLGVTTTGDRDRRTPIEQLGSVNVFVKELESALRERRADFAVHSCKDLPGLLPDDMHIAAISQRADPRDVFCSERYRDLASLPAGAVVGTSSPRRRVQLEALRLDLRFEPIRGNVDTRLRKLASGEYDAIVLAAAGLDRLHASAAHVVPFPVEVMVPAVGQGALAVETRAEDERLSALLHDAVNDPEGELCVACEREALRVLRAGCSTPLGIHAMLRAGTMVVNASFEPERGALVRIKVERAVTTLEQARELGAAVAAELKSSAVTSGVAN
ncbi:MAG TPA: hydroxymethylbilane synthase [Candidatus Cybelea sp.]|jgi:hydroxymethylbilane synthase|nr:hydroxymethylbilane synthase [Candidatus Cybelea sp.]